MSSASPTDSAPNVSDSLAPRRVFLGTLAVVGTALAFFLAYLFADALLLLFIGIVLATAVRPLIQWLRGRGLSTHSATVSVYALLLLAVAGLMSWFLPVLFDQVTTLGTDLPSTVNELADKLQQSSSTILRRLGESLPGQSSAEIPPAETVQTEVAVERVAEALSYGNWAMVTLLSIVAVLMIAFYWSLQEERTLRAMQLALPPNQREGFKDFIATIQLKLGAYVRGQGILCLVVGALNFIAFLFIGLPYATTLGVLAGIMEAVPVFGPVLAAVAPAAIALTTDPSKVIWVLLAALVIQQLENYLLVPRIMQNSVGVNPIVTLLAIAAFGTLLGVPGAILAIPLAALVQLVLDRWIFQSEALEPEPPKGRDALSVARYHARDLIHDVRVYVRNKEEGSSHRTDAIEEAIESIAHDLDLALGAIVVSPDPPAVLPEVAS